jgi:hypothetical protein
MENRPLVHEELETLQKAALYIRKESGKGNLVEKDSLKDALGIREDEMALLLAGLPDFSEFTDLRSVMDENGVTYFYSGTEMTDSYMEILVGLKNKNILKLIAGTVRYESEKYPRPTRVELFTQPPYSIGCTKLEALLHGLGEKNEYNDLKFTQASNGTRFLYSERHMTGFYAAKLAEWQEVLQHETP